MRSKKPNAIAGKNYMCTWVTLCPRNGRSQGFVSSKSGLNNYLIYSAVRRKVRVVGDFYIPIDQRFVAMFTTCGTFYVVLRQRLRPEVFRCEVERN